MHRTDVNFLFLPALRGSLSLTLYVSSLSFDVAHNMVIVPPCLFSVCPALAIGEGAEDVQVAGLSGCACSAQLKQLVVKLFRI